MDTSSPAADKSERSEGESVYKDMPTNGDFSPSGEVQKWQVSSSADQGSRMEDSSSSHEDTKDGMSSVSSAADLDDQNTKTLSSGEQCESSAPLEFGDKNSFSSSSNKTASKQSTEDDDDDNSSSVKKLPSARKRKASNNVDDDLSDSTSTENSLDSSGKVTHGSASKSSGAAKRPCLSENEKSSSEKVEEENKPSAPATPLSQHELSEDSAAQDAKSDGGDKQNSDSSGEQKSDLCSRKSKDTSVDSAPKDASDGDGEKDKTSGESKTDDDKSDKKKDISDKEKMSSTSKPGPVVIALGKHTGKENDTVTSSDRQQVVSLKIAKPFQSDKNSATNAAIKKTPITNFDPYIREMTDEEKTKLEQEAGFPEFLRELVKLGKYIPVKRQQNVDVTLRTGESLIECPSQVSPLLVKKPNTVLSPAPPPDKKSEKPAAKSYGHEYFGSSSARLLMTVGFSRALEWYEKDMVKVKERQLKRNNSKDVEDDLQMHRTAYLQAKHANEPFNAPLKKCQDCDFRTESEVVLEGHNLTPHFSSRREFKCSFCSFLTRDMKAIVFHMEAMHGKKCSVEPPRLFYECPFCPFETNLKTKATSHINKCQKYFFSGSNQAPVDNDFPGITAKPVTLEDIRMYEINFSAIANANQIETANNRLTIDHHRIPSGITLTRIPSSHNEGHRFTSSLHGAGPRISNPSILPLPNSGSRQKTLPFVRTVRPAAGGSLFQVVSSSGQVLPMLNSSALSQVAMLPPGTTVHAVSKAPQPVALFPNVAAVDSRPPQVSPRPVVPSTAFASRHGPHTAPGQNSFVICEICDGYIKDLEQLRTHMQWIHKVKIHPKMLASRPPLNCQKCQWRFFTDQGLERHLLGAHGLVTSNMQDMVNSNQDGGRCTICGKVFACKLVAHMSQIHKITLKPAHLSYKCTVCSATFNLYRLFENHVYMVHSGAMKRPSEDGSQKKKPSSTTTTQGSSAPSSSSAKPASVAAPKSIPSVSSSVKDASEESKEQPAKPQEDSSSDAKSDPKNEEKSLPETASKNGERPKDAEPPDKDGDDDLTGEGNSSQEESDDCGDGINCKPKKCIKPCGVKLCRIEKCEKCLYSFDGLVVLHTSDFGVDEEEEDDEEENVSDADDVVCEDDDEIECLTEDNKKGTTPNETISKNEDAKENDIIELEVIQEINRKNDHLKTKSGKPLFMVNNVSENKPLANAEAQKISNKHSEENGKDVEDGEKDIEVMEEICTVVEKENDPQPQRNNVDAVKEKLDNKLGDDVLPGMKVIDISHFDESVEEIA